MLLKFSIEYMISNYSKHLMRLFFSDEVYILLLAEFLSIGDQWRERRKKERIQLRYSCKTCICNYSLLYKIH